MNKIFARLDGHREHTEFLLRILFGAILVVAGSGKLFGKGISGTIEMFERGGLFAAPLLGTLVPLLEFFGGIAILLGVFTRLLSAWAFIQFLVIAVIIKPFLWEMGWRELRIDVVMAVLALYFLTHGSGPVSAARKFLPGKTWAE